MKKTFWDRTAKIYDHFMKKDHKAYQQMYSLIYPVVRHKQVLKASFPLTYAECVKSEG